MYALVRDDAGLPPAYRLEPPRGPGPVQRAFGIEGEAAYALCVKTPEAPGAAPLGEGRTRLPRAERCPSHGRRHEAEGAAPLDLERVEIPLTGVGRDAGDAGAVPPRGRAGSDLLRPLPPGRDHASMGPLSGEVWA